jgi:diguanylate cyclase (GGDEF)-like protein/PAS domain S-box-containing protein
MITDASNQIVDINPAFTRMTGYELNEVVGLDPAFLHSGRHESDFYLEMWQQINATGRWQGEIWNRRKNGEAYDEILNISAVRNDSGKTVSYVGIFSDITPLKEHRQQLEHIAHYDALTNLPNRVLLADRLQQAMIMSQRRNNSVAVVYLDLDGFKAVNDTYGHEFGDELLIEVSQRMKDTLRDSDTLARIGGDEFVVVLVDLEQMTDCEPLLIRLLQAAAEPVKMGDIILQVSASIGVTFYPQDKVDADQLVRHADQAMYGAKQMGKNRYHLFDIHQDIVIKTQRESLDHIRRALNQQEFTLYYQPKVNMKSGKVIGAEALIRWQHPERGLLPPAVFLPIIESHPISIELGEWVINTALTQMGEWQAAGLHIPVSVNIGARQIQQQDFSANLSALLSKHPDVQPSSLELEVLETSALGDVTEVSAIMHACLELGVSFALDDFGTGYSSLTYLRRLPADMLKIDQSFVRDMLDDPGDLAIINGIIGLASAFQRQVIAEGVETIAHGSQLLSMGCMLAQGYGIARPMPASDLPNWVANWKPDAAWMI